jgi:hypothetical protein
VARVVLAVLGVGPVALMVRGVRVGLGMTVVGWMEMAGLVEMTVAGWMEMAVLGMMVAGWMERAGLMVMTVVGWMDLVGLVVWMALEGREPFQEK